MRKTIQSLRNIKIRRRFSEIDLMCSEKHFHLLCDGGSKVVYATCIFEIVQNEENVSCQLIQAKTGKSSVAPLKEVIISRLELFPF